MRKIVISTNIAETSVTIDDITIVIDSGKMKEMQYDPTKSMSYLKEMWVSKANAQQRTGRAGRVKPGICYHLFTKTRYQELQQDQVPEIKRTSLEQLCLRIKVLGMGNVEDVLRKAIEPPDSKQVNSALNMLRNLHALEPKSENLTALGYHLAVLPVDIRMGKMMIYGAMLKCLDPILTIAASMGFQSPLISPIDAREEADRTHKKLSVEKSDHLTVLECYKGWKDAKQNKREKDYCRINFLSNHTFKMIEEMKFQFLELLQEIGFVTSDIDHNINADNNNIIKACLVCGLYPNVLLVQEDNKGVTFHTAKDGQVYVHPSSVLFKDYGFSNNICKRFNNGDTLFFIIIWWSF
jgi:HrpA-like RNA helicase